MSRVAVAGASGLVGSSTVRALRAGGHDAVEVSRSQSVDVLDRKALDRALSDVDAVVDVLSFEGPDAVKSFVSTTRALLEAEERNRVGHHVLLSIVNVDWFVGSPHSAGKLEQEAMVAQGPIPWTLLRATQFFEYPATLAHRSACGGIATLPPIQMQLVAAGDVAQHLAELAVGPARGRVRDIAGPSVHDLVHAARRTLAALDDPLVVRAGWGLTPFSADVDANVLLPGDDYVRGATTFTDWLEDKRRTGRSERQN